MSIEETQQLRLIAFEGFIRRAAEVEAPFMLKGSLITRQYYEEPTDRIPGDLDWIYLEPIEDVKSAEEKFNEWAIAVTQIKKNDGVKFRNFTKNAFWREIDYAMADDFPTVNTDILCWVDGKEVEFGMDLSFNLPLEYPPIYLVYRPIRGDAFHLSNTVPLCLQISWKVHQSLIRPRFKDFLDLMHLVQHWSFNDTVLAEATASPPSFLGDDKISVGFLSLISMPHL